MIALIASGLVVLAVALFVATRKPAPSNQNAARSDVVHSISGDLRGRQEAQLEVLDGAESVTIHSDDLGDFLYRASTLPGSTVEPTATDDGTVIKLGLTGTSVAGQATVHIYLNTKVRWQLKLAGGGLEQAVDFGTGRLAGLEILAGTGRVDLSLPKPEGSLIVRVPGGAGQLAIHAAAGVPAQLTFAAGSAAGTVTVDGQAHQGLKPGAVLTPDGWAKATDRYDIQAGGGIATVTVDRR